MLEGGEPGAVAPGIAADAPVQGGGAAQRVVPLVSPGAIARYLRRSRSRESVVLSIGLIVARLPQTYMPKLLVC
jgi:hypothetical protein